MFGKTPASLIIPKTDTETIMKIQKAVRAAYEEGKNKLKGKDDLYPYAQIMVKYNSQDY